MSLLIKKILTSIKNINEKTKDTGWQNLELQDGVIAHNKGGSSVPQYKKIRKPCLYTWSGGNKLGWRKSKNYCSITRADTELKIQHILSKH